MEIKRMTAEAIRKLPIPVIPRMKLERACSKAMRKAKAVLGNPVEHEISYYPLVWNNRLYGNEFLLRRYAGLAEDLYTIIEHGLFLGRNSAKVSLKHEWELGCILTGGNYRKDLIKEYYPDYYCEAIGPMIHYAREDGQFKEEISSQLEPHEKTVLLYPMHGNDFFSPVYNIPGSMDEMIKKADELGCRNVIVCVYYRHMPMFEELMQKYRQGRSIIVTTNGNRYNVDFMDRQKTQIALADYTISNSLGTHVGFCLYMGKPHVILPQAYTFSGDEKAMGRDFGKDNRSSNYYDDFKKEEDMFHRLFNGDHVEITEEQYRVCDYYWGFSQTKTSEQIREIAENCKKHALVFTNNKKSWGGGYQK